jgi:hypothetical protein
VTKCLEDKYPVDLMMQGTKKDVARKLTDGDFWGLES